MSLHLIRTLTLAAIGAGPLGAQAPAHAQAEVNDPRSHGQVGDLLLSLNETIQLNNYTLNISQLSPEENAQIYGLGDVAFVQIDALAVPKLTFERDLDVIQDNTHGFFVSGMNGIPVLEMGTTNGFVSVSNYCDLRRLILKGGKTAITITQTDTIYGSLLEDMTFEGQTVAGIRLVFQSDSGSTRIQIDRCRFLNLPLAVAIDDLGTDRRGTFFMADDTVSGCQRGIAFTFGPGGDALLILERIAMTGTADGIRFTRTSATAGRAVLLEARHLDIAGGTDALSISGSPTGQCQFVIQSSELSASGSALSLSPSGDSLDATIEDLRTAGPVHLAAGRAGKVTLANARLSAGTFQMESVGAPLLVTDSILTGMTTTTSGPTAVRIEESRLVNGSVAGAPAAQIVLQRSHTGGTTIGSHVNVLSARAAAQIGSCDGSPLAPLIGGNLGLLADLPASLSGLWFFGATAPYPTIAPRPFHFYMDVNRLIVIPAVVRLNTRVDIPIPNDVQLRGADLYFQLAVVPDPTFDAPPLSLPPGRRVLIK